MHKVIAMALTVGLASSAFAGAATARVRHPVVAAVAIKIAPTFKAADSDGSKSLSSSEFASAGGNADNFGVIDANNNGELGFFELLRAVLARFLSARS